MRSSAVIVLAVILVAIASIASAQECEESVHIDVYDGTIEIHHIQARYNCCAWLDIEVVQDGYTIDVIEWERFEAGPCYCLCCFDSEVTIAGLDPGDYTVTVWKTYNNFDGSWEFISAGTWTVRVEGNAQPSVIASYVPCAETGAPETVASWGVIKALYE